MPSIKLAATSVADFIMSGTATAADLVTSSGSIDLYSREGMDVNDGRVFTRDIDEPFTDFWCRLYSVAGGDHLQVFQFFDPSFSTTQAVLRLRGTSGLGSWVGQLVMEAWNGSSWTVLATSASSLSTTRKKIDVQYVRDNSAGIVRIYIDNSLDVEVTGIDTYLAAWTSIGQVQFIAATSAGGDGWAVSGIIISDSNTRNLVFVGEAITGNGAETDWNGSYTAIDELGLDVADGIDSATTDDVSTFTGSLNAIIDSGYDIVASIITVNVNSVGGASDLAGVHRIAGTSYETSPRSAPVGPSIQSFIVETSPATASPFTAAEIEGAEIGIANKT